MLGDDKKDSSLVSIIVPCYNHSFYVQSCIQSIIEQDYANIELIVIDDGSTDDSVCKIKEIIPQCRDRFVRFEFRHRENKGLSYTLNEAIDWVSGDYLSMIASDDVLVNNKVSLLMYRFVELDERYAAVFGDACFIDGEGRKLYLNLRTGSPTQEDDKNAASTFLDFCSSKRAFNYRDSGVFGSYASLLEGNYLPAMGTVLRTRCVREVGSFTRGIRLEDWDLWLKLSRQYLFFFEPTIVAYYRLHGGNTVSLEPEMLLHDSLKLLERESKYALRHGFEKEFFLRKATSLMGLIQKKPQYLLKNIKVFLNIKVIFYSWIVSYRQLLWRLNLR